MGQNTIWNRVVLTKKIMMSYKIFGHLWMFENLIKKTLQYQFCVLRHKSVGPKHSWQQYGNPRKSGKKTSFPTLLRGSVILKKADLDEFFWAILFLSHNLAEKNNILTPSNEVSKRMLHALSRCFKTQKLAHQSIGSIFEIHGIIMRQFLSMSSFWRIDAFLKVHFNFYFNVNMHFYNIFIMFYAGN